MPTTITSGSAGIDLRDFHSMVKGLRKAKPELNKELRKGLRAAGVLIAEEAKTIAGQHSNSIPPTIRVRTAGATVAILAGTADVPLAVLYEIGNTGKGRVQAPSHKSTFRHPVFGNREVWVEQDRHPFLEPAAVLHAAEAERMVVKALDRAMHSIVFDA